METINIPFNVFWRLREFPHLKVTRDKKIINSKTGKLLKYQPMGFFIGNMYVKRKDLNELIEKIPQKETLPF